VASVRGILTNPTYTGQIYIGRMNYRPPQVRRSATHPIGRPHATGVPVVPQEWIPAATVPALITEEQFQLVQAKLATNQSFARRNNTVEPYLLRALVSCGQCGLSCTARKVQSHHTYYLCSGKWRQVRQRTGRHCPSRFIPASQLDALVWSDLCDLVRHPHIIAQALERAHAGHWLPQELQARCENLRRGHVSLQQQLDRLTEAYLSGVIPLPEYQRRRVDLEQRLAALTRQEAQLHQQAQRLHEAAGLAASVETFCQRVQISLETATFTQKRQLVELLIDRVIVTGEEVEIRYVIPTSQRSEHIRFCHLRLDYFPHPHLIGLLDVALPSKEGRSHWVAMTTVSCHGTTLPRPAYRHTGRAHQPPGFISADRTAVVLELFRHAAPAIAVARLVRNRFHVRDPGDLVTINRGGRATLQVSVESAVAHVKYLTEHGDWPRVLVLGPTGIFHRGSLTKKRMAFFKISPSIRNRLTSSRSWRSSSCSAVSRPLPGKAVWASGVYSCFHRRSILTLIPKFRAVSATP
jgi:hypothetical protein